VGAVEGDAEPDTGLAFVIGAVLSLPEMTALHAIPDQAPTSRGVAVVPRRVRVDGGVSSDN